MFWPVVQEISFNDISIFSTDSHFVLSDFGRGHHEKHFCENILNLDQWFRCHLKIFLI